MYAHIHTPRCIKAFRQFLYLNSHHVCCVEVHVRLAYVFKLMEEHQLSIKVRWVDVIGWKDNLLYSVIIFIVSTHA